MAENNKGSIGGSASTGSVGGNLPSGTAGAKVSMPKAADKGPFKLKTGKARDTALIATGKNQPGGGGGNQQVTARSPQTRVY